MNDEKRNDGTKLENGKYAPMQAAETGLQSVSVANIARALANAQASFTFAGKSSEALGQGGKKRRYADLQSVLEAVRQGLSQNGIALCQQTEPFENGFSVRTLLIHESGEWLASLLPIPDALWRNPPVDAEGRPRPFNPMQQLGSCITYARRYALSALAGISQDDDDGESLRQSPSSVEAPRGPVEARNGENGTTTRGGSQNARDGRQAQETRLRKSAPVPAPQKRRDEEPEDNRPDDAPASKDEVFALLRWLTPRGYDNRITQRDFVCHQLGIEPTGWDFRQLTVGNIRALRNIYREANRPRTEETNEETKETENERR